MLCRGIAAFLAFSTALCADPAFDAAMSLLHANRLPEARDALARLVTKEPRNASAWHELGMIWRARGDTDAYQQAVSCLEKAVELDASNPDFLADYGGASMELASRTRSISAATNGRTAMEKAVELNPDNLDAREGLYQYYLRAPFFVGGSTAKAEKQLEEIRRRDPDRATVLAVIEKTDAKDFPAAFQLCDAVLAKQPDNYTALYQYGRTASISGQSLARGLACLQRALELQPPGPAAPRPTHVWYRIGVIEQKLGRPEEARHAFEMALKLEPTNPQALKAMQALK